jgi:hypothetical protein
MPSDRRHNVPHSVVFSIAYCSKGNPDMHTHDTCTEEQASQLAGVSARTLQRFAESGYLAIVLGEDGRGRYQRQQLEEIFGAARSDTTSATIFHESSGSTTQHSQEATYEATLSQPEQDPTEQVKGFQPSSAHSAATTHSGSAIAASIEIERLKNLLAIQERMLDSKDDEIADLKNQRAWLRERVEKLEEKSDRDQILLLSETQTIRSLIAYQESRKSTVRQFLEWIGLSRGAEVPGIGQSREHGIKPSQSNNGRTIEVRKAANAD